WVRFVTTPGEQGVLVGTIRGAYWLAGGTPGWKHLASGLPAAEMLPIQVSSTSWLAAAKSGGLYLSRDEGGTWNRLDTPFESSLCPSAVSKGADGSESSSLIAASRTEGLLRWSPTP